MSASWVGTTGLGGTTARSPSLLEEFGVGPLTSISPNVPPLVFPKFSSPATRPSGPSPFLLSASHATATQATPFFGGLEDRPCFGEFGELADQSKIGDLPTDDDLLLRLFDPPAPALDPGLLTHPALSAPSSLAPPFWPAHPPTFYLNHSAAPLHTDPSNLFASHNSDSHHGVAVLVPMLPLPEPAPTPSQMTSRFGRKRRGASSDQAEPLEAPTYVHKRAAVWAEAEGEDDDSPCSTLQRHRSMPSRPSIGPTPPPALRLDANQRTAGTSSGSGSGSGSGSASAAPLVFRGVSRHRLTQRWEASLWLAGRQLYLGGFDSQQDAARAYDLAALACKGPDAVINFPAGEYDAQLAQMRGFSREEVVAYVRRRSAAFSRGKSRHRGVSGHNGRWEARIGSFGGKKNVSFGVFETEEGAARQYDRALILEKGRSAKTNFPLREYEAEVVEFESYLTATCGAVRGAAAARAAQDYTLPRDRVATADEKKRSAIIYGEALRRALSTGA